MERSSSEWGIAVWGERMCEKRKERTNERKKIQAYTHKKRIRGGSGGGTKKYIYENQSKEATVLISLRSN